MWNWNNRRSASIWINKNGILKLFFFILATIRSTDDENMEDLRSQVDFLNSVIVDMQRKNDELKAKMELLESAGILETIGKAIF